MMRLLVAQQQVLPSGGLELEQGMRRVEGTCKRSVGAPAFRATAADSPKPQLGEFVFLDAKHAPSMLLRQCSRLSPVDKQAVATRRVTSHIASISRFATLHEDAAVSVEAAVQLFPLQCSSRISSTYTTKPGTLPAT